MLQVAITSAPVERMSWMITSPIRTGAVACALLMISIEMVLGNIIDPRMQGMQLNISPLVILISLAVWGYVWGLPGMFLSVPLTSMMQIICANVPSLRPIAILLSEGRNYRKDYDRKRRKKKSMHEETGDIEMPDASQIQRIDPQ